MGFHCGSGIAQSRASQVTTDQAELFGAYVDLIRLLNLSRTSLHELMPHNVWLAEVPPEHINLQRVCWLDPRAWSGVVVSPRALAVVARPN